MNQANNNFCDKSNANISVSRPPAQIKVSSLCNKYFVLSDWKVFINRSLPRNYDFSPANDMFPPAYFVNLHYKISSCKTNLPNFCGA